MIHHETTMKQNDHSICIKAILRRLSRQYPAAACPFPLRPRFRLLVAVVLSAQCTDAKVIGVLPGLWKAYPTPGALAEARPTDLARILRPLGLFRAKARFLIGIARVETANGIEWNMDGLTALPGVGRKTANVVLGALYGRSAGIAVDTHVRRISQRLDWTKSENPIEIESDLMRIVPQSHRARLTNLLIAHGRAVCRARWPLCGACPIADLCPSRNAER
jgi:endonuclease-3